MVRVLTGTNALALLFRPTQKEHTIVVGKANIFRKSVKKLKSLAVYFANWTMVFEWTTGSENLMKHATL